MKKRFRVKSPNVMQETIEGEVIVIDLTTGSYYSLREAGATIWHAVERGADSEEIGAALAARYEGDDAEMHEAAQRLLAELEREGLVEVGDDGDPSEVDSPELSESDMLDRVPFRPPLLEKHTDMQELILLDPVHEVGARGWPHTAEGAREQA